MAKDLRARLILETGQFNQDLSKAEKRAKQVTAAIERDTGKSVSSMRSGMFGDLRSSRQDTAAFLRERTRAKLYQPEQFDAQIGGLDALRYRTARMPGRGGGGVGGGEAFSFEKLAIGGVKASLAFEGVTLGLEAMAAGAKLAQGDFEGFKTTVGAAVKAIPLIGSALAASYNAGEEFWGRARGMPAGMRAIGMGRAYDTEVYKKQSAKMLDAENAHQAGQQYRAGIAKSTSESLIATGQSGVRAAQMMGKDEATQAKLELTYKIADAEKEASKARKELGSDTARLAKVESALNEAKSGALQEYQAKMGMLAKNEAQQFASIESDTRARVLDAMGRGLDAEKERIKQSYQEKIDIARSEGKNQIATALENQRDLDMAMAGKGKAAQIEREHAVYGAAAMPTVALSPEAMAVLQKMSRGMNLGVIGRAGP